MKVIIAGSRPPKEIRRDQALVETWYQEHFLDVIQAVQESGFEITEVVCGGAQGYDTLGQRWAERQGIPVKPFPAQWRRWDGSYDADAGFRRNAEMAEYADALIAIFWGKPTSGTQNMIARAKTSKKLVQIVQFGSMAASPLF